MQVSDIICATIVDYLTEITPNLDPYFHERLAQLLLLRVGMYFLGLIILSILIFLQQSVRKGLALPQNMHAAVSVVFVNVPPNHVRVAICFDALMRNYYDMKHSNASMHAWGYVDSYVFV
jgi:hypothetical protein